MSDVSKVKLNKKKCETGMDTLEFSITLEGMENLSFDEEPLPNDIGKSIVTVKCVNGKVIGSVSAVHCIRNTNAEPFSLTDCIKMEIVRNKVFDFIRDYLKRNLGSKYEDKYFENSRVTSLEVNITRPCVGKALPSDMCHFLNVVFGKAKVFTDRKPGSRCDIVKDGIVYEKKHLYQLKIYDKEKDLHRQGVPIAERKSFRLEVVFKDRKLNSMFGENKRTLDNVLSAKSLDVMCRAYKEVFDEIIEQHIIPWLNDCVADLFESLTQSESGNEISDTIMRHKNIIVDVECLRRALKRWYKFRGVEDRSKQMIHKYRNKDLGLAEDVLKTLRAFHQAAG